MKVSRIFIYYAVVQHRFMAISPGEVANEILAKLEDGVIIANRDGWISQFNNSAQKTGTMNEADCIPNTTCKLAQKTLTYGNLSSRHCTVNVLKTNPLK